jgi:hypothetical protein
MSTSLQSEVLVECTDLALQRSDSVLGTWEVILSKVVHVIV